MTRPLPPLNAVRAFEAAARHLSFSRAAEELGVTQGAISKQIVALEDNIGSQLFERDPNGISLTQEGYTLKEALVPAFAQIADAFAHYSRRPPRTPICRISTTASFAAQFLAPRLDAFKEAHPDIGIEFITSIRLVDLTKEEIDVAVRYGPGEYEGLVTTRLVEGALTPICRPDLLQRARGDLPKLLRSQRRIQSAGFNEWREFASQAGIDPELTAPNFVMEDFLVCLKAVLSGQGLAILPDILVRDQLRTGELARFSPVSVATEHTFHIAHTTTAGKRPHVQDVISWLKAEASA